VISYILLALDIITILFLMYVAACPIPPLRPAVFALRLFALAAAPGRSVTRYKAYTTGNSTLERFSLPLLGGLAAKWVDSE